MKMGDNKEKRMISNTGYEIKQAFDIGGIEVMLGENTKAENNHFYLVCNYKEYGIIGEFSQAVSFDDYFEAVEDYKTRIFNEIEKIKIERDNAGLPVELFTSEHCYPHNRDESIAEQVIIIKPEALSPEYRRGDVQLFYATHGNGIRANANGNAVYGYYLYNGQQSRIERYEVMGVIKELPEWAKEHLARVLSEKEKPTEDKQFAGRYEIIERVEVGEKIFALGYSYLTCKTSHNVLK